jgi:hypothetical protein
VLLARSEVKAQELCLEEGKNLAQLPKLAELGKLTFKATDLAIETIGSEAPPLITLSIRVTILFCDLLVASLKFTKHLLRFYDGRF